MLQLRFWVRAIVTGTLLVTFLAGAGAGENAQGGTLCGHYVNPNPFSPNLDTVNDAQGFVFCLNESAHVSVTVKDHQGTVRVVLARPFTKDGVVHNQYLPPGLHTFGWTGTDSGGRILTGGNYRYEIVAKNGARTEIGTGVTAIAEQRIEVVSSLETEILELMNGSRVAHGLVPLEFDSSLRDTARAHSLDMRKNNYFSHESPTGTSLSDRLRAAGIIYTSASENLVAARPNAQEIHDLVMSSATHRSNVLKPEWRRVGIGVAAGVAEGSYNAYESQTTEIFVE